MDSNPKYGNPPVVETVIGVQFPRIDGFCAAHFGLYWETIRDRYPKVEDQPRLDPNSERFPRLPVPRVPRVQLVQTGGPDRVWFTAETDSELIQLQSDRFLFNWREREKTGYPSYKTNSKKFFNEFQDFQQFCEEHKLLPPTPKLCEVTYVNHFMPEEGETAIELAGKVFNGLRWETADAFLPTPEGVTFNRTFVIREQNKPVGRLYAETSIAARRDNGSFRDFVAFSLTGRVNHNSKDSGALAGSLELAHKWVVRGFAAMTDRQIQDERWRRER